MFDGLSPSDGHPSVKRGLVLEPDVLRVRRRIHKPQDADERRIVDLLEAPALAGCGKIGERDRFARPTVLGQTLHGSALGQSFFAPKSVSGKLPSAAENLDRGTHMGE